MKPTKITLILIALTFGMQPIVAQGQTCNLGGAPITDLKDPLINGATSTAPFIPAPDGQPPPMGQGTTPAPVIPGMPGPSTLLPWVPAVPSNDIDLGFTGIPLPVDPAVETPPAVLGPLLTPVIPPPPSTPGTDPGNLTAPAGSFNPAEDININPNGGIPGTGGFCTTIPTLRRGGQDTTQWELRGRNSVLGGAGGDGSQDEVTRLGPMSGFGVPFGVPTGDGLRNSSIDLGGGTRFKVGTDTKLSGGSSVQDYGLSTMRGNPIGALDAQQSYEFGQGWRRIPLPSSNTTDFGFYYMQFSPANEDPQKKAQLLLPKAVETNF